MIKKKIFRALFFIFCLPLRSEVTNVIGLSKRQSSGEVQAVYLIGALHIFSNQLSSFTPMSPKDYSALVKNDANAIVNFFKKTSATSRALMMVEAQFPLYDQSINIVLASPFCDCQFSSPDKLSCTKIFSRMKAQYTSNDTTNFLEMLAKVAKNTPGIEFPDKRSLIEHLKGLLEGLIILPSIDPSQPDYKACQQFASKHGPTVEEFFTVANTVIATWLEDAREVYATLINKKNKQQAQDFINYLLAYKNKWKELEDYLSFPSSSSMPESFLSFIRTLSQRELNKLKSLVLNLSDKTVNEKLLLTLDYSFLRSILNPQAPQHIFIVTGFLHPITILPILTGEGYQVLHDSGLYCKFEGFVGKTTIEKIDNTRGDIVNCRANYLKTMDTPAVQKALTTIAKKTEASSFHEEL